MIPRHARLAILIAISVAALTGCTKSKETQTSAPTVSDVSRQTPDPAQRPAPILTRTSATIGPKGGTLSSSDNRLSLSIPSGSFGSDTQVSIEPTTGGEGGLGAAYRLMPEGVTFLQPVTLAWHLSAEDLAQTNLDNLDVSSQAANGAWTIQEGTQRDEATHTVSVSVAHFSRWQLAQSLDITPASYRLYVGDPLLLMANLGGTFYSKKTSPPKQAPSNSSTPDSDLLTPPSTPDSDSLAPPGDDMLAPPAPQPKTDEDEKAIFRHAIWRVNGQTGGNSSVGTIKPAWFFEWGDYVAPAQEPSPSRIVTVSVEVTLGTRKMIASALVEILPHQNHWIGTSRITQFDGTTVSSNFTFVPVQLQGRGRRMGIQRFEILNGMVYYRGPKATGGGCPLDIKPTFHKMQPKDGMLNVDMQNPSVYLVNGGGQAVWSAIYESRCPNGTQFLQSPVSAAWWPTDPSQMMMGGPSMTPVKITPGQIVRVVIHVDTPFGKGTVTLQQDSELKQPGAPES